MPSPALISLDSTLHFRPVPRSHPSFHPLLRPQGAAHRIGNVLTSGAVQEKALPTVLVADDDADILRLISQRLTHRGYHVVTAKTGDEALRLVFGEPPDAAVLDGIMPGIEGHEICAKMRSDGRTAEIPVVLLTAKAADADHRDADEAGVDAYILKPFRIEELDEKLRELLASARERRR
jgi:CheY-like chemotaxis protein